MCCALTANVANATRNRVREAVRAADRQER